MSGKALRALRRRHKLSTAKAAEMVYVSRRTWVRWETLDQVPAGEAELFKYKMRG